MSGWDEGIIKAFENLGGSASYGSICAEIEQIRSSLPIFWRHCRPAKSRKA